MARGPVHSKEFRDEAVRLSYTSGKMVSTDAKELGIKATLLHEWRRKARLEHAVPVAENEATDQTIKRLQRENELLREEAAILKMLSLTSRSPRRSKHERAVRVHRRT